MERDMERGEGRGVKNSWPNGYKAINRVKNSLLWSGTMNTDILRPFSPMHKHLFGVFFSFMRKNKESSAGR